VKGGGHALGVGGGVQTDVTGGAEGGGAGEREGKLCELEAKVEEMEARISVLVSNLCGKMSEKAP
jgi:hypothetical protein